MRKLRKWNPVPGGAFYFGYLFSIAGLALPVAAASPTSFDLSRQGYKARTVAILPLDKNTVLVTYKEFPDRYRYPTNAVRRQIILRLNPSKSLSAKITGESARPVSPDCQAPKKQGPWVVYTCKSVTELYRWTGGELSFFQSLRARADEVYWNTESGKLFLARKAGKGSRTLDIYALNKAGGKFSLSGSTTTKHRILGGWKKGEFWQSIAREGKDRFQASDGLTLVAAKQVSGNISDTDRQVFKTGYLCCLAGPLENTGDRFVVFHDYELQKLLVLDKTKKYPPARLDTRRFHGPLVLEINANGLKLVLRDTDDKQKIKFLNVVYQNGKFSTRQMEMITGGHQYPVIATTNRVWYATGRGKVTTRIAQFGP